MGMDGHDFWRMASLVKETRMVWLIPSPQNVQRGCMAMVDLEDDTPGERNKGGLADPLTTECPRRMDNCRGPHHSWGLMAMSCGGMNP